jgi:hypothetical protein
MNREMFIPVHIRVDVSGKVQQIIKLSLYIHDYHKCQSLNISQYLFCNIWKLSVFNSSLTNIIWTKIEAWILVRKKEK